MGQIWLHIGTPKTGSTSLQGFLSQNEEQLRRDAGINYMTAGRKHIAHNPLAAAARRGGIEPILDAIVAEADAQPELTHVISSEMLFNFYTTRKLIGTIPDALRGRTKVLCYVRRQDIYLEALYKQLLKNSRIQPDRQAFLEDSDRHLRYFDVLSTYAEVCGAENIIARPFSTKTLLEGDVVLDFAKQIGLTMQDDFVANDGFANKTFSAEMSEMLATMGEVTDFNVREVIRELSAIDHPGTIRSRDVFTIAQRRALMAKLAPDNAKLVETFMPGHGAFFDASDLEDNADAAKDEEAQRQRDRHAATQAIMIALRNIDQRKSEEAATPASQDEPQKADGPPSWYREIYPAGPNDGWFRKFGDYSCSFVERGRTQLVVSFDNLSQAGSSVFEREPWAQKFCADRGFSHLGVYAQASTWFRSAALIDQMDRLRDEGFFDGFEQVSFVGTSMGGFGALAFCGHAPGSTVLAFSPQTTLDNAKVPWEGRFAKGRAADWSLPYSDAADTIAETSRAYVIYDPYHGGDRAHVERLSAPNLVPLKGIGLGHKSALVLNRMDVLKPIMEAGIAGTLTPAAYYKLIRSRKDIYLYRLAMEDHLRARDQEDRRQRFGAAFRKRRRQVLSGAAATSSPQR